MKLKPFGNADGSHGTVDLDRLLGHLEALAIDEEDCLTGRRDRIEKRYGLVMDAIQLLTEASEL